MSLVLCPGFELVESAMADSPRIDPKDPQNMNAEMFARFLEFLAPDTEEAGRRYTRLHKKLTGFFRMKGISDPESAVTIDTTCSASGRPSSLR